MLCSSLEMLQKARKEGYAVGSFNYFNMESAQAIVAAADQENAPVMLQVWSGFDPHPGLDMLGAIGVAAAKAAKVPVAVHLDHGATLAQVGRAIRAGMTSVMLDGSALELEKNIAVTKTIVDFCKDILVPVEGEIGHVGGSGEGMHEDAIVYTDPDEAAEFVERTGVDFCAVSIGTFHGVYQAKPELNIELLKRIAQKVSVPLVLHGSSYTPDEMLAAAVKNGISKINVATELSDTMVKASIENMKSLQGIRYANQLTDMPYARMQEVVCQKIRLFGSSNRA